MDVCVAKLDRQYHSNHCVLTKLTIDKLIGGASFK